MGNGNERDKKNELQLAGQDVELTGANIFSNSTAFNLAARMSKVFSESTIVPKDYQGNPANCMIAIEMAVRLKLSPMMVMQNLYIVSGRPVWSSQFVIAAINSSGKYKTELQFDMSGKGDSLQCYAYAIDRDGRKVFGPTITMEMAKKEGWLNRGGSKWQAMPEIMIRYRAASFFGRLNCPDMIMGIYASDDVIEIPEENYSVVSARQDKAANAARMIAENANKDEAVSFPTEANMAGPAGTTAAQPAADEDQPAPPVSAPNSETPQDALDTDTVN